MKKITWLKINAAAAVVVLAAGCAEMRGNQTHHASSLFTYLYPNQTGHVDRPGIPVLSLPLRVGVAFVPDDRLGRPEYWSQGNAGGLTEVRKMDLLKQVSAQFKGCPFVSSIEIIPDAYLTPRGSFANLDQIKTMYGIDVMVLLAYDQAQFTGEGLASLSYWTIVGAYVVPGEKNDTQTMIDAAVYDIASRKLLFRAPGLSTVKGLATPINLSEKLRHDSQSGFDSAATNLTASLKTALVDFQERVKSAPADYQIIHKPGYTGAAGFGGWEVVMMGGIGASWLWTRRTR